MELEYFDKLWSDNRYLMCSSSQENEAFWDDRADMMKEWKERRKNHNRHSLIDYLQGKKMLQPDFSVLDIGCGPGEHAKNIAHVAKEVVGTDISGKMLDYARNSLSEAGLSNAMFVKIDWDEVDLDKLQWNRKFDLVFASMTPAIGNINTLKKMIQASKQFCFSTYPVSMKAAIGDKIAEHLRLEHLKKHDSCITVYCLVNMLFLLGYYPEIHYEDQRWESNFTIEEAMTHFNKQFCNGKTNNTPEPLTMRAYLQQIADQGIVSEVVETKTAWVSWKV